MSPGILAYSKSDRPGLVVPAPHAALTFVPLTTAANPNALAEIVVGAPDAPQASLAREDGTYASGDLWAPVDTGRWAYRGRVEDWLKLDNNQLVDTK